MLDALSSFKDINTIIIKDSDERGSEITLNRCIETTKQKLNDLAPSKERRYIRVWHTNNDSDFQWQYDPLGHHYTIKSNSDIFAFVRDYYSEIRI